MDKDVSRLTILFFIVLFFGGLIGAILFSLFGKIFIFAIAGCLFAGLMSLIVKMGG